MELKTTRKSLSFWRDIPKEEKARTYNIRQHQIVGLSEAAAHTGVVAGLVINFRDAERTYFISIDDFLKITNAISKKSVNEIDISSAGILIPQRKLRVNWRYDIQHLIDKVGDSKGR